MLTLILFSLKIQTHIHAYTIDYVYTQPIRSIARPFEPQNSAIPNWMYVACSIVNWIRFTLTQLHCTI